MNDGLKVMVVCLVAAIVLKVALTVIQIAELGHKKKAKTEIKK